jgi:hypothetical protein
MKTLAIISSWIFWKYTNVISDETREFREGFCGVTTIVSGKIASYRLRQMSSVITCVSIIAFPDGKT